MKIEAIKYASKDYVNYLLDKQEYHNENYTEDDIRQAFEKGAMLVLYRNLDLFSLWHYASEEPDIEDTYVYILYIDKYDCPRLQLLNDILTYYDNKTTWNEAVKLCGISKWAYLRDLLPKNK